MRPLQSWFLPYHYLHLPPLPPRLPPVCCFYPLLCLCLWFLPKRRPLSPRPTQLRPDLSPRQMHLMSTRLPSSSRRVPTVPQLLPRVHRLNLHQLRLRIRTQLHLHRLDLSPLRRKLCLLQLDRHPAQVSGMHRILLP